MRLAWEAGQAVIVALLLWIVAAGILTGMLLAGLALTAVRAWKWIRARTTTGPRSPLDGRLTPELRSSDSTVPETAERRSEPQPRMDAA